MLIFNNNNNFYDKFNKIVFKDKFLYYEKYLYILKDWAWLHEFQVQHNFPKIWSFEYNKNLELISRNYK